MYDGQQQDWVQEEIDLHDFIGQKINIQFELFSDGQVNYSGYYFDNVSITTVQDSPIIVINGVQNITGTNPSINIYPNPAHNQLTISVTSHTFTQPLNAVLYDCTGREVMHITIDKPTFIVDVSQLPGGVYYLKTFENEKGLKVMKVVVER